MSSNSNFTPSASLASAARTGPEINLGPETALAMVARSQVGEGNGKTCQDDELSTVLVTEAVLALPRKNVCGNLSNVPERNRRKLLAFSDRQRQDLFLLSLERVQQEILCVEPCSVEIFHVNDRSRGRRGDRGSQ
jgi:hypothetical protein